VVDRHGADRPGVGSGRHSPSRAGRIRQHLSARRRRGLHRGCKACKSRDRGPSIVHGLERHRAASRDPSSGVHGAQPLACRSARNDSLSSATRIMAILQGCFIGRTREVQRTQHAPVPRQDRDLRAWPTGSNSNEPDAFFPFRLLQTATPDQPTYPPGHRWHTT
jgi:hypothetical protein